VITGGSRWGSVDVSGSTLLPGVSGRPGGGVSGMSREPRARWSGLLRSGVRRDPECSSAARGRGRWAGSGTWPRGRATAGTGRGCRRRGC
jgi:hypothetical protein